MTDFGVCALLAGVLPTPRWATTFGANDTSLQDLSFYVWVVNNGSSLGLVDLGLPLDAEDAEALSATNRAFDADGFRSVRLLPELLATAGIDPADVEFVALTQTATYHTGGLDADLLPNARVFAAWAGVSELLLGPPGHPPAEFYFTDRSWRSLRQLAVEGRLHLVDAATEIVPGVVFEPTGGHHPGSAAVRIATELGTVGLVETSFLQRDLDDGVPIGVAEDVATTRSVIHRFRASCTHAVAIHDPANATRFPYEVPR